jgi:hypothetical protein
MSNDNVTILHNRDNLPPPAFTPEFTIAATTGYAATDDGMTCVLRTLTPEGIELRLVVPTVQIEAMIGALRAVKMVAAAKTNVEAGESAVFMPRKYETMITPNYHGVLLAFDRGTETETIIGMDHASARDMGRAMQKQARDVANRPGLILPPREIATS